MGAAAAASLSARLIWGLPPTTGAPEESRRWRALSIACSLCGAAHSMVVERKGHRYRYDESFIRNFAYHSG
jgi:hypothetical protein